MDEKPLVYVAGPYSKGDKQKNVANAMAMGEVILRKGGLPYIPHLSHFWDTMYPKPYEWWLVYDKQILIRACDCVVRLMGESSGADDEVLIAVERYMKVYSASEVWHEDFYFPSKATFQSNAKLAARGACVLPPCYER